MIGLDGPSFTPSVVRPLPQPHAPLPMFLQIGRPWAFGETALKTATRVPCTTSIRVRGAGRSPECRARAEIKGRESGIGQDRLWQNKGLFDDREPAKCFDSSGHLTVDDVPSSSSANLLIKSSVSIQLASE